MLHSDVIYELLLWYNHNLETDYKRQWTYKGLVVLRDIVDSLGIPMSPQEFTSKYRIFRVLVYYY